MKIRVKWQTKTLFGWCRKFSPQNISKFQLLSSKKKSQLKSCCESILFLFITFQTLFKKKLIFFLFEKKRPKIGSLIPSKIQKQKSNYSKRKNLNNLLLIFLLSPIKISKLVTHSSASLAVSIHICQPSCIDVDFLLANENFEIKNIN